MFSHPPRSTQPDTLVPYTTVCQTARGDRRRSGWGQNDGGHQDLFQHDVCPCPADAEGTACTSINNRGGRLFRAASFRRALRPEGRRSKRPPADPVRPRLAAPQALDSGDQAARAQGPAEVEIVIGPVRHRDDDAVVAAVRGREEIDAVFSLRLGRVGERIVHGHVMAVCLEPAYEVDDAGVAQTVINRVRHPSFPNTVCGVVFQGSQDRKKPTSELQSLMRISYAVFCLKKKRRYNTHTCFRYTCTKSNALSL